MHDRLENPAKPCSGPLRQPVANVSGIRDNHFDAGEHLRQLVEYEHRAVLVPQIRLMHDDGQQQTHCIHGDVPFSPAYFLAGVEASFRAGRWDGTARPRRQRMAAIS
jgi:hypothetical protein